MKKRLRKDKCKSGGRDWLHFCMKMFKTNCTGPGLHSVHESNVEIYESSLKVTVVEAHLSSHIVLHPVITMIVGTQDDDELR